jgi:hypothetical protein
MQPTNVFSKRTKRIVANYNRETFSDDLYRELNNSSRNNNPPPLAEGIIASLLSPPPILEDNSFVFPHQVQPEQLHFREEQDNQIPSSRPLSQGSTHSSAGGRKKKAGVFGYFRKFFKKKKPPTVQVNLNDFSSVSSKESQDNKVRHFLICVVSHSFLPFVLFLSVRLENKVSSRFPSQWQTSNWQ